MTKYLVLFVSLWSIGCGNEFAAQTHFAQGPESLDGNAEEPQVPTNHGASAKSGLCLKLDFAGLDWPIDVEHSHQDAFSLALNISGSFEGHSGWQNLTNNFDGQGMSYGLLNQCLGQGSLQPLLIQMRNRYRGQLDSSVPTTHRNSMLNMLSNWEKRTNIVSTPDLSEYGLSDLDSPEDIKEIVGFDPREVFTTQLLRKNQDSVNWAVENLYSGSSFKAAWKTELKTLAQTPGYRSIQVEAANRIHQSALRLFKMFRMSELRSYLFFFDVVVQNGGLPDSDIKYLTARFSSAKFSETQKLNEILTRRLTHVKQVYRNDVKSRKQSIIRGSGTVHGSARNYSKEYCTSILSLLPGA